MIKLIAAIDLNSSLGFENKLLTKLPNDMKHFRELTTNQICVFGRKTYESIGHALPNRTNIVLTRDRDFKADNVIVYHSVDDVLRHYYSFFIQTDLMICGGSEIYKQFLPYAQEVELTLINHTFSQADAYFVKLDDNWKRKKSTRHEADEYNPYAHWFVTYERQNLSKTYK